MAGGPIVIPTRIRALDENAGIQVNSSRLLERRFGSKSEVCFKLLAETCWWSKDRRAKTPNPNSGLRRLARRRAPATWNATSQPRAELRGRTRAVSMGVAHK